MSRSIVKIAAATAVLAAMTVPADAGVDVHIDKSAQRMYVAVDGVTRYVWAVSTGASGYDTPGGSFRPFRMERDHFSATTTR
jgi:lipoprotein-anchoring transpeptidase ErfK/SrfK